MEQLMNAMTIGAQPAQPASPRKDAPAQKDGFQKLMAQKQSGAAQTSPQQEKTVQKTQDAGTAQDEGTAAGQADDPKELEERMVLAAMLMAQAPAVQDIVEPEQMTPQSLSDPAWTEGMVPVGHDGCGDLRIVHWMQPGAETREVPEEADAGQWLETAQDAAEAAQETVPEVRTEAPAAEETRAEALEVRPRDAETSGGEDVPELRDAEVEAPVFGQVESAPVKVGEAPAARDTAQAEDIGEQIGPKLVRITSVTGESGERSITVSLEPEHLGKVQVEVSLSEDGTLHVALHAENSRTQSLLDRNSEALAAVLGRHAQQEVRMEAPRQEESRGLYEQQQQQHQQHRQEQRRERRRDGEEFLQQLRLGLVPLDGE